MKHIIFFNTKGGSGKSTLCQYSSKELSRLGIRAEVVNTDQQQHVTTFNPLDPSYCLYDTAGVFAADTLDLLRAAANADSVIVVPTGCGKNDAKEIPFIVEQLNELQLLDKAVFVPVRARTNSKALATRRESLKAQGLNVSKWFMPLLEDFSEQRDTARTRNEISQFINEVVL